MILQQNIGFTVAESTSSKPIFRVGSSDVKATSATGESGYLSFNANETKTIALPLGYSSDNIVRFVGKTNGTLELNITHPTLSTQTITIKGGGIMLSMRMSSISITEKAGSPSYFEWSIMQKETTNSEEFS